MTYEDSVGIDYLDERGLNCSEGCGCIKETFFGYSGPSFPLVRFRGLGGELRSEIIGDGVFWFHEFVKECVSLEVDKSDSCDFTPCVRQTHLTIHSNDSFAVSGRFCDIWCTYSV